MAGRRPTDPYWVDRIRQLVAENPKQSSRAIHEELVKAGRAPEGTYPPAPRTIDGIRSGFLALPEVERQQYEKVYWPETFVAGGLPWDASFDTLELMHGFLHHGDRPTVRLARWFHRVSLAMPHSHVAYRVNVASALTAAEAVGGDATAISRQIEGWLAYRAWLPRAKDGYESAVARGRVERWEEKLSAPEGTDQAAYARALSEVAPGISVTQIEGLLERWEHLAPGETAKVEGNDSLLHELPAPWTTLLDAVLNAATRKYGVESPAIGQDGPA